MNECNKTLILRLNYKKYIKLAQLTKYLKKLF